MKIFKNIKILNWLHYQYDYWSLALSTLIAKIECKMAKKTYSFDELMDELGIKNE